MIYERLYIQFNDLVFDGFDMISDYDSELTFKGSSTEYSYGHGSYRPFKRNYLFVAERSVTMTITLNLVKIPCDQRRFYIKFAEEELAKPGKLWCIKNGELLWAVAVVENISENFSRSKNKLVYNISFVIPGGIWYKADTHKTFLLPWNVCSFMECKDFRDPEPCLECCETCTDTLINKDDCSCCCTDSITEDMALCHHLDDLQSYYTCDTQYQIRYDCELAERFSHEKYLGSRLCVEDVCKDGIIAGQFYSNTDIPTEDVTVIITGQMHNPWITINDNTNIIEGDYDGALIIKPNGDVYYQKDKDGCCEPELLDGTVWSVPSGNEYGWTVNPRTNSIIVNLNVCCNAACVYIQAEAIAL